MFGSSRECSRCGNTVLQPAWQLASSRYSRRTSSDIPQQGYQQLASSLPAYQRVSCGHDERIISPNRIQPGGCSIRWCDLTITAACDYVRGLVCHAVTLLKHMLLLCCDPQPAGAFSSYMSAISSSPAHVPSLMALASLYKAKGMLDEAAGVLRKALQAARNSSNSSCSSSNSNSCSSAGQETAAVPPENDSGVAAGKAACDVHDSSSSGNSSSENFPTAATGAVRSSSAGGEAAGAVPLSAVQEALAVVLTDLGTRAKNAGRIVVLQSGLLF